MIQPGTRLPSWQDLAAQLGVARGTVRPAYSALADHQLVTSSPTNGTRVVAKIRPHRQTREPDPPLSEGYGFYGGPAPFRMGVPARDLFPAKLFARLSARCARAEAVAPDRYPDPRGEDALRSEIAAHLAISRGVLCAPSQIFVTTGFLGGLGLLLRTLRLSGLDVWTEAPCFPVAREALRLSGLRSVPVPMDEEGIRVDEGRRLSPGARLALVTPGQQAPLGMTLSPNRRHALLDWAADSGAWIVEDDYLGELQLRGRAAPALAAIDSAGRVIHIGSFSKTISPVLRLGFIVVPPSLVPAFTEAAPYAGQTPGSAVQNAVAAFLRDGHYLRHLRRVKRALSIGADDLRRALEDVGFPVELAGLAALARLPPGASDTGIALAAAQAGMAPAPLSAWYAAPDARQAGLLLGVASARGPRLPAHCAHLRRLVDAQPGGGSTKPS